VISAKRIGYGLGKYNGPRRAIAIEQGSIFLFLGSAAHIHGLIKNYSSSSRSSSISIAKLNQKNQEHRRFAVTRDACISLYLAARPVPIHSRIYGCLARRITKQRFLHGGSYRVLDSTVIYRHHYPCACGAQVQAWHNNATVTVHASSYLYRPPHSRYHPTQSSKQLHCGGWERVREFRSNKKKKL
jgi:hypothetical protein